MKMLCICDSHEAGVALIEDGKIVYAISEERLSREKSAYGFPWLSLKQMLKDTKVRPSEIDAVIKGGMDYPFAYAFYNTARNTNAGSLPNLRLDEIYNFSPVMRRLVKSLKPKKDFTKEELEGMQEIRTRNSPTDKLMRHFLKKLGIEAPLFYVDHHVSHVASAYYTSGFDRAITFSLDFSGDGKSGMVAVGNRNRLQVVEAIDAYNSTGCYYSFLTKALGFRINRHEGKITGLAAYGKPDKYYDFFKKHLWFEDGKIRFEDRFGFLDKIKEFRKHDFEDLATAGQRVFEEAIVSWIDYFVKKHRIYNVALAGGVFSNVKLNQRVAEIKGVRSVFVFPHMGDGGLSVGAGLYYFYSQKNLSPSKISAITNVYFGPEYSKEEIEEALKKYGVKYEYHKNIEKKIAGLIAKDKVVARFNGRMEYGPRALGNRSVLYKPTDPEVNKWLNKKLKRSDFMPFAPSTMKEYGKKCYRNLSNAAKPAEYMAITFDCTDFMKKNGAAAVHVDNTARPQLVDKNVNPSYYKILNEFRKLTGIPLVVNTSFNMHEEPIVCSPDDAIRSFLQGNLDYLAIGDFLVSGKQ